MQKEAPGTRKPKILFILDDTLVSFSTKRKFSRLVKALSGKYDVKRFSAKIEETEVLDLLSNDSYALVLAPWEKYLAWRRIEAFFGVSRSEGPTFAGYYSSPTFYQEMTHDLIRDNRAVLLDFYYPSISEIYLMLNSLIVDEFRSGIRPFIGEKTPIFCETWYSSQGLGQRPEVIMKLPRISSPRWASRANAVRISLNALWSLIYEEGPGKGDFIQNIATKTPRAYFQIGADHRCLFMRLCFAMPNFSPNDACYSFWPDEDFPLRSTQLLLKYADFVRVHRIIDTDRDVEITVGFFKSNSVESAFNNIHTLWVDPISRNSVIELPYMIEKNGDKYFKPLPSLSLIKDERENLSQHQMRAKDRYIERSTEQIKLLRSRLVEKEAIIEEMKMGGVNNRSPYSKDGGAAVLGVLKEQYFASQTQVQNAMLAYDEGLHKGASRQRLHELKEHIRVLREDQITFATKLNTIVQLYRGQSKKTKKAA